MEKLKKKYFALDGLDTYIGYDLEQTWNGWACPVFDKENSLRIMEDINKMKDVSFQEMIFDKSNNQFVLKDISQLEPESGEPLEEIFEGREYRTVDGSKMLYPIGAYSWMWYEDDDAERSYGPLDNEEDEEDELPIMKADSTKFSKEEQDEYDIDEFGNTLSGFDHYVRCTWCERPTLEDNAMKERHLGWLCSRCAAAIMSRGEKLKFYK